MHFRARLLAAALLPACAFPALAERDPLLHAQGLWQGTAKEGGSSYEVTASLKKVNSGFVGAARTAGFIGEAAVSYATGGYSADITFGPNRLVLLGLEFQVSIQSGTSLKLKSHMGEGTLRFKDDFTRCEFVLGGGERQIKATLFRTHPPPSSPKPAGGKGKKAPPPIPPFIMVR